MRRIAMLLLCAVACAGLSSEANSATPKKKIVLKAKPITKAPPAVPSSAGSGFYVGVNGGYSWGRATLGDFTFFENTINARNGMAGLTFGYNAQSGSMVYGFETDIDAAWMKTTNWGAPPCVACELQLRYFGTVRGRLGYAVNKALPYLTAGLAYGSMKTSSLALGLSDTDTKLGWTAGAGIEYAIYGAWSAKAEYLYFELGRMTCGTLACGTEVDVKLKGNLVRTGLNYRF
jgi:outer membrane immunogenic protein